VELGAEGKDYEFQVLKGLSEGEEIVVSAQFMLDSESRLREAIQKMLDVRSGTGKPSVEKTKHNMKDDAPDMSNFTMDVEPGAKGSHQHN
jgi:Cu(I)/Ag(I) efflux system membrane fusion protein/cobalt-zinc-cadmium efflux system membrane fusion protein